MHACMHASIHTYRHTYIHTYNTYMQYIHATHTYIHTIHTYNTYIDTYIHTHIYVRTYVYKDRNTPLKFPLYFALTTHRDLLAYFSRMPVTQALWSMIQHISLAFVSSSTRYWGPIFPVRRVDTVYALSLETLHLCHRWTKPQTLDKVCIIV